MTKEERLAEKNRLLMEANTAKERLAKIAAELEELGFTRKARSAMNLVYTIEAWQNRN